MAPMLAEGIRPLTCSQALTDLDSLPDTYTEQGREIQVVSWWVTVAGAPAGHPMFSDRLPSNRTGLFASLLFFRVLAPQVATVG